MKQQGSGQQNKQQSQSGKTPSNTLHTHKGKGTGAITPSERPGAGQVDPLNTDDNKLAQAAAGHRSPQNKRD